MENKITTFKDKRNIIEYLETIKENGILFPNLYDASLISDNLPLLIKEFEKDLNKNVNMIYDFFKIIQDGETYNFKKEDLNKYFIKRKDKKTEETIKSTYFKFNNVEQIKNTESTYFKIKDFEIKLDSTSITKANIKEKILQKININNKELIQLKKSFNLIPVTTINKIIKQYYKEFGNKIINNTLNNSKKFFNDNNNEEIKKITKGFSRTMIDGIVKGNTYINEKNKTENVYIKHKKDINKLLKIMEKNKYISDIEIDKSANLKSVIVMIEYLNKLDINIQRKFTLKIRKLGNYNVEGLYSHKLNMVCLDVNSPSSLIHEITHLIDIGNNKILLEERKEIVEYFSNKMTLDKDDKKSSYFYDDKEIIARLSEINFLINNKDFQTSDKISVIDNEKKYLINSDIYFNFSNFNDNEKEVLKDYFKNYYSKSDNITENCFIFNKPKSIKKLITTTKKIDNKLYESDAIDFIDTIEKYYFIKEQAKKENKTKEVEKFFLTNLDKFILNINKNNTHKNQIKSSKIYIKITKILIELSELALNSKTFKESYVSKNAIKYCNINLLKGLGFLETLITTKVCYVMYFEILDNLEKIKNIYQFVYDISDKLNIKEEDIDNIVKIINNDLKENNIETIKTTELNSLYHKFSPMILNYYSKKESIVKENNLDYLKENNLKSKLNNNSFNLKK